MSMNAAPNKQAAIDALEDAAETSSTTQKSIHVETAKVYSALAIADAIDAASRRIAAALATGGLR